MNYGHPLKFGTFITPLNKAPEQVVALAKISETLGYDLVTFQDHPYQPAFLDTWTLMSWVAAQTEYIHLAPNVLNLPLRSPAVLARSAASLDLLSSGRLDLALGAGAFWDGIVAMGGRRMTPGQAVEAVSEGIDILRAVWDVADGTPLHFKGKHYQLEGIQRGPLPTHDIPLWIGALKPRILNLTGRVTDGWLPSLGYLEGGLPALKAMNQHIDEGAVAAGRDPTSMRRLLNISGQFARSGTSLLNGPQQQWAEQLAEITLEYGISGFILMADDVPTIELFEAEVAPPTRELVAAERAHPQPNL